jgi:hypothetical protein
MSMRRLIEKAEAALVEFDTERRGTLGTIAITGGGGGMGRPPVGGSKRGFGGGNDYGAAIALLYKAAEAARRAKGGDAQERERAARMIENYAETLGGSSNE